MKRANLGFMVNQKFYCEKIWKKVSAFAYMAREPQSTSKCLTKWCIDANHNI